MAGVRPQTSTTTHDIFHTEAKKLKQEFVDAEKAISIME